MEIVLTAVDKGGDHTVAHDLNFREEKYITKHPIASLLVSVGVPCTWCY